MTGVQTCALPISFAELTQPFAESSADLRQLAHAEDYEDHNEDDQGLRPSKAAKHTAPFDSILTAMKEERPGLSPHAYTRKDGPRARSPRE